MYQEHANRAFAVALDQRRLTWAARSFYPVFTLDIGGSRPIATSTPRLASTSARSFPALPSWPRTQCQSIAWPLLFTSSSRACHSSTFLTGCLVEVRQPLAFQPGSHSVMPLSTYWLSTYRLTAHGRLSACSAWITAISSMRLLVVSRSPPKSSFSVAPDFISTPQPPGPGFPLQAPSV